MSTIDLARYFPVGAACPLRIPTGAVNLTISNPRFCPDR